MRGQAWNLGNRVEIGMPYTMRIQYKEMRPYQPMHWDCRKNMQEFWFVNFAYKTNSEEKYLQNYMSWY